MEKIKVLTVFGTRPEAIKMAPLIKLLEQSPLFNSIVCVTAQHRQMLDQVLQLFNIKPDFDLNIMKPNQNLWTITCDVLLKMKEVFQKSQPNIVLVHGDTTTSMAAALSAYYSKIKIGHVEAGLRTFNLYYPFPEEINRVFVDALSNFHFAPTDTSVNNLIKANIPKQNIYKTGNTVIDALFYTLKHNCADLSFLNLNSNLKTIVVTSHRRENFGQPLINICNAILELIQNNQDIQIVFPVHLNPNVQKIVYEKLDKVDRIILTTPLDYAPFATLMQKSYIIMTDSGGVQEEAPALGKPVFVLRDTTERPEAVEFGTVKLVGTKTNSIVHSIQKVLNDPCEYKKMADANNPYGDGFACQKIISILEQNSNKILLNE